MSRNSDEWGNMYKGAAGGQVGDRGGVEETVGVGGHCSDRKMPALFSLVSTPYSTSSRISCSYF